jgi:hypothetical protein
MSFQDWFSTHVTVSGYVNIMDVEPGRYLHAAHDVFLNVSDEYAPEVAALVAAQGRQYFWFPLGEEWGIGLASIYGALNILWRCEQRQQRVYLHCHAGVNRSQTVADCYYFARSGRHRPWPGKDAGARLLLNCSIQRLPAIWQMEAWLKQMNYAVQHPMGGWLDASQQQAGFVAPGASAAEQSLPGPISIVE